MGAPARPLRSWRVAAVHEAREAALKLGPRNQDMPATALAPDADIRSESIHKPRVGAARVTAPQADHITQEELEHRMGGHRGRA